MTDIAKFISNLQITYDSGFGDDLAKDFYSPCLENCTQYKRFTGDFTSNVIFDWGKALTKIIERNDSQCIVKIIANPNLLEDDLQILKETLDPKVKERILENYLENLIDEAEDLINKDLEQKKIREVKLKIFAYLIVSKKLIIKFGFPKHVDRANVFHTKRGIFYFDNNLKVAFVGSSNETHGGHHANVESIDVYHNLNNENKHLNKAEERFDLAWQGRAPGFDTIRVREESLKKLKSYSPKNIKKFREDNKNIIKEILKEDTVMGSALKKAIQNSQENQNIKKFEYNSSKDPYLINNLKKWDFQKKARDIFIKEKFGILEMATGTGKTKTALGILSELLNQKKINKIIIQMDGNALLSQWDQEITNEWRETRPENIRIVRNYKNFKNLDLFKQNYENKENIDLLLTSRSNLTDALKFIHNKDNTKTIIIHDEVHDLPTDKFIEKIQGYQKTIEYRLGLSATVKNDYSEERNENLFKEVGPIIFGIGLDEAIERGVLVELDFIPLYYELTEIEKQDRSKKRQQLHSIKDNEPGGLSREQLMIQIAKINKEAENKIEIFNNFLKKNSNILENCFIFTLTHDYGNKVLKKILNITPYVKTYYNEGADTDNLKKFSNGELKCIVSCKSLSQGINLNNLNNVVFFSIDGRREFIQRLGRVLRSNPKNPNKKALIIDFFENEQFEKQKGSDYDRFEELNKLSTIKFNQIYAD